MLQLFKDAQLTRPALEAAPKWFLFDERGGERETHLWLGDAYYVTLAEDAAAGATEVKLDQTVEIPDAGTLTAEDIVLDYTAKTANSITVAPLALPLDKGLRLRPQTTYTTDGNLTVFSRNASPADAQIALKAEGDTEYNLATAPYIFPAALGATPVRVDVRITCRPGMATQLAGLRLEVGNIRNNDLGWTGRTATAYLAISRRNQELKQQLRILAPGRELRDRLPGFVFGSYRWRDRQGVNAGHVVPTRWDADVVKIGTEKFIAGIGHGTDLQLLGLEKNGTSIHPIINGGHYFTDHRGYYLPASPRLEFLPALEGAVPTGDLEGNQGARTQDLSFVLEAQPGAQKPVFVGRWRLDQYGYYNKATEYRYVGKRFSADQEFDPADEGYQFTLDRNTRTLKLNKGLPTETIFVGVGTDADEVTFDLPVHPIAGIGAVYCDSYGADGQLARYRTNDFTFNREQGTLRVGQPTEDGQIWRGNPIFAECVPAVAVLYDADDSSQDHRRPLTEIDLNPAFAGISKGNLYLMHRRWKPRALQLFADKPRIAMPASMSSLENCVAFGPVFYERDFAMLLATAYGTSEKDFVPNVRLRVQVDETFQGYINYRDPLSTPVEVITGGDGSAGLVYLPNKGYGVYLDPVENVENGDTLVLPVEVPYSQVCNALDGWLTKVYVVRNDDPYLGMLDADPTKGQLPWTVSGVPGTLGYQTNGRRVLLKDAVGLVLTPSAVYDSAGRTPGQPGFTGAKKVKFANALPTGSYIGAFFLSYVGRVTLKVVSDEYGLESNSILLQLSAPEEIVEAPPTDIMVPNVSGYLILDDEFNGILSKNRLCGGSLLNINDFVIRT